MQRWISIALITGAVLGCSKAPKATVDAGDEILDGAPDVALPDAVGTTCDPLQVAGMQGCATGKKCTWIQTDDTPEVVGKLGCVPDGTVAIAGSCEHGPVGETTGFDNCVAGSICIGAGVGVCKDLCGFETAANAACGAGDACVRHENLGTNDGNAPVVGACSATCDPLTQTRVVNNIVQSCGVGKGCYLLSSPTDTTAVCATAGTPTHNQPIVGITYASSCAPGHMPRAAVQGVAGNECASLCKPADVFAGSNEAYEGGNSTVTNYAGLPATCESAGGSTVRPEVPTTGESCQYYWSREPAQFATRFSNTLGWCFNHASWKYDPDDMSPISNTAAWPRCPTLTTGDVVPPVNSAMPFSDALSFFCVALVPMWQPSVTKRPALPEPKLDRLGPYR